MTVVLLITPCPKELPVFPVRMRGGGGVGGKRSLPHHIAIAIAMPIYLICRTWASVFCSASFMATDSDSLVLFLFLSLESLRVWEYVCKCVFYFSHFISFYWTFSNFSLEWALAGGFTSLTMRTGARAKKILRPEGGRSKRTPDWSTICNDQSRKDVQGPPLHWPEPYAWMFASKRGKKKYNNMGIVGDFLKRLSSILAILAKKMGWKYL